jgi:hypothetical protein
LVASDKQFKKSEIKFAFTISPYASISHKLKHGRASEIDPVLLAAEIREHGFMTMPAEVQTYLCDFLEGNVEKRGRKGKSDIESQLESCRAQDLYKSLREAQSGAEDAFPAAVDIYEALDDRIEDAYSPSEAIWRMVAILMRGNQGHHKAIKNLAGKAKAKDKTGFGKPARK